MLPQVNLIFLQRTHSDTFLKKNPLRHLNIGVSNGSRDQQSLDVTLTTSLVQWWSISPKTPTKAMVCGRLRTGKPLAQKNHGTIMEPREHAKCAGCLAWICPRGRILWTVCCDIHALQCHHRPEFLSSNVFNAVWQFWRRCNALKSNLLEVIQDTKPI